MFNLILFIFPIISQHVVSKVVQGGTETRKDNNDNDENKPLGVHTVHDYVIKINHNNFSQAWNLLNLFKDNVVAPAAVMALCGIMSQDC